MNKIPYEERCKTYMNALIAYGDRAQMIVAVEELSECQKEICKILRGGENFDHLAEEIADATIMLEQVRLMFNLNEKVCEYIDAKVQLLDDRLKKEAHMVVISDYEMTTSKPLTNADRIRGMTDEELAAIMIQLSDLDERVGFCKNLPKCESLLDTDDGIPASMCEECMRAWLKQPAEVGDG